MRERRRATPAASGGHIAGMTNPRQEEKVPRLTAEHSKYERPIGFISHAQGAKKLCLALTSLVFLMAGTNCTIHIDVMVSTGAARGGHRLSS